MLLNASETNFLFSWHYKSLAFQPHPSSIYFDANTFHNPVNSWWIKISLALHFVLLNVLFTQKDVSIIGEFSTECWFCRWDSFIEEFIGLILTDNLSIFLSFFVFTICTWKQSNRKLFCPNVQYTIQAHNPWAAAEYRCRKHCYKHHCSF